MKTIRINIDRELATDLERVNHELNFNKDIIQRLIETHPNDAAFIGGDTFRAYQKQGAELNAEYSILAAEIEKAYIPELLKGHQYSWIIPNNSAEMLVTITCNCEIDLEGYEIVK